MLRRTTLLIVSALLAALALTGVAQAREAIRGPAYRTYAPSGWHIDKGRDNGWNTVTITPPQHVDNGRDTALVSIAVASVKTVKKLLPGTPLSDKAQLVKQLISIPKEATSINNPNPPTPTRFRGKPAMTVVVNYTYTGHGTVHIATLIRRGQRIYLIQTITDEDLAFLGNSAVDMIRNNWRWKK